VNATPDGAIVLAGGTGRRLGGVDKAALVVGSHTLLQTVLAAVPGIPVVVVGPAHHGTDATFVREDPPGGGPAAGVAAGIAALLPLLTGPCSPEPETSPNEARFRGGPGTPGTTPPQPASADPAGALVAVLAVDQPGVTGRTLRRLVRAVPSDRGAGAVLTSQGRRQYTAGVFPVPVLAAAVAARASWHGVALRALVDPLVGAEVPADGDEARDVDTPDDLAHWRQRRDDRGPVSAP